jgi:hypothetical protein
MTRNSTTPTTDEHQNIPLLHDIFGLAAKPVRMTDLALDRTARVQLLAEAAIALLDGRLPDPAARVFLAGGINSWLQCGGSLTKKYWETAAPRGSNDTEAVLWQKIREKNAPASRSATEKKMSDRIDPSPKFKRDKK